MNYYEQQEKRAIEAVDALLAKPTIPADGLYSDGECFDPWDLFPCLYGTYSREFDDLAIAILSNLKDNTYNRADLAAEMFREILCTTGLCDYGTSPRACFPTTAFEERLPRLIERWREFSQISWSQ